MLKKRKNAIKETRYKTAEKTKSQRKFPNNP